MIVFLQLHQKTVQKVEYEVFYKLSTPDKLSKCRFVNPLTAIIV